MYRTNKKVDRVPERSYEMGERVLMEDDILENDNMRGYSIQVDSVSLLECGAFMDKYGISELVPADELLPERVYDVTVTIENEDNKDTGIDLTTVRMQAPDIFLDINSTFFDLMYPKLEGSMAIALREDSSMEFHLAFNVRRDWFRESTWKRLDDAGWKLVLTKYPVKKYVKIEV